MLFHAVYNLTMRNQWPVLSGAMAILGLCLWIPACLERVRINHFQSGPLRDGRRGVAGGAGEIEERS